MTLIVRDLNRNRAIARRFGAAVGAYDAHAHLQGRVAENLAAHLPARGVRRVLEVGCGTGFLTGHLLDAYGAGEFLITDLAPEMVAECRKKLANRSQMRCRFAVMDGEAPDCGGAFDLIATAMTLQWFADPLVGLARLQALLTPEGELFYATLGPESFGEWRAALAGEGLAEGVVAMPALPGVFHEEREVVAYEEGKDFLGHMRAIGAGEPRPGYRPLPPGRLRRACRALEHDSDARVTWHFVYGRISPLP